MVSEKMRKRETSVTPETFTLKREDPFSKLSETELEEEIKARQKMVDKLLDFEVYSVEIDTLNITARSEDLKDCGGKLFVYLKEKVGKVTPLIEELALCEREGLKLGAIYSTTKTELLIRSELDSQILKKMNSKTVDEVENSDLAVGGVNSKNVERVIVYRLNGGFDCLKKIMDLDKDFFVRLAELSKETEMFRITRVDLCWDTKADVMWYVSRAVQKSHYWANNNIKPYGMGTLNGVSFQGPIGRQSKNIEKVRRGILELTTMYVGNRVHQAVSVLFYNKRNEQMSRYSQVSYSETRIEVRITGVGVEKIDILKLLSHYNEGEGIRMRARLFLDCLTSTIHFTTKQRATDEEAATTSLANWWENLILKPLLNFALLSECSLQAKKKPGRPKGKVDSYKRYRRKPEELKTGVETAKTVKGRLYIDYLNSLSKPLSKPLDWNVEMN